MFVAPLLLVIQFCLKNDTKYSNFLQHRAYIDSVHRVHIQHIAQAQIRKAQLLVSCIIQTCATMLTSRYSYHIF